MAAPRHCSGWPDVRAMPALNVNQVALALKSAARPFPVGSTCTTSICGAGLLDARRSLDALTGSVVRIGWNEPAVTLRGTTATWW